MTQPSKLWLLKESRKRLTVEGKEIWIKVRIFGNTRTELQMRSVPEMRRDGQALV